MWVSVRLDSFETVMMTLFHPVLCYIVPNLKAG
jgi:hypothetical protein